MDPSEPRHGVLISRDFAFPRALVFEAWTRAEHLERWFGPDGFTTTATVDFRPGGEIAIRLVGYGMDHTVRGHYREIVPDERIVFVTRFDDVPDHPLETTVTFSERAGTTTITVRQEMPTFERASPRDRELLAPRLGGAPEGWRQTLANLARALPELRGA